MVGAVSLFSLLAAPLDRRQVASHFYYACVGEVDPFFRDGVSDRNRTGDDEHHKLALYLLSYTHHRWSG